MQKYERTSSMLYGIFSFHFCFDTLDILAFHISPFLNTHTLTPLPPAARLPPLDTLLISSRRFAIFRSCSLSPCDVCFVSLRARPLLEPDANRQNKNKEHYFLSPVLATTQPILQSGELVLLISPSWSWMRNTTKTRNRSFSFPSAAHSHTVCTDHRRRLLCVCARTKVNPISSTRLFLQLYNCKLLVKS